ncbi:hypothetical protein H4O18_21465 [Arenibacter sp. BSSL-BM3]|uniref:Uncharacterized protein n=1 Tax=Arenibacter arenosicollis TaxID=2762274 RepID=A0ABR7QTR3_9FLAO|nr:hypothetical protein [Arenibacter arenosicollis]MBC8770575.1 hypothetical protein [Arenibacter arenosicollis]
MKANKKRIKDLNHIYKMYKNLLGLLNQDSGKPSNGYRVSIEVKDNSDLLLHIASLLEVCVFALDGNGILLSPNNQNVAKHDSVCRVLELVLNMLPHSQMELLDKVKEKLNGLERKA